jgi:hypothetical protein
MDVAEYVITRIKKSQVKPDCSRCRYVKMGITRELWLAALWCRRSKRYVLRGEEDRCKGITVPQWCKGFKLRLGKDEIGGKIN